MTPGSGLSPTQNLFIREDIFPGPASEALRWRRGRAHSCPGTESDVRGRVGSEPSDVATVSTEHALRWGNGSEMLISEW